MSQVNTELGRSATANISLNETTVRTLAGVPSGAISMQDLRGKSAFTLAIQGSTGPSLYERNTGRADAAFKLVIGSSGNINMFTVASSTLTTITLDSDINNPVIAGSLGGEVSNLPTAWGTPVTSNVGSGYEVNYSGRIRVIGSGSVLRVFGVSYTSQSDGTSITTPYYALSQDRTITGLATGSDSVSGVAELGASQFGAPNPAGTISIRKIGTTTPVASFTISYLLADKEGD